MFESEEVTEEEIKRDLRSVIQEIEESELVSYDYDYERRIGWGTETYSIEVEFEAHP